MASHITHLSELIAKSWSREKVTSYFFTDLNPPNLWWFCFSSQFLQYFVKRLCDILGRRNFYSDSIIFRIKIMYKRPVGIIYMNVKKLLCTYSVHCTCIISYLFMSLREFTLLFLCYCILCYEVVCENLRILKKTHFKVLLTPRINKKISQHNFLHFSFHTVIPFLTHLQPIP